MRNNKAWIVPVALGALLGFVELVGATVRPVTPGRTAGRDIPLVPVPAELSPLQRLMIGDDTSKRDVATRARKVLVDAVVKAAHPCWWKGVVDGESRANIELKVHVRASSLQIKQARFLGTEGDTVSETVTTCMQDSLAKLPTWINDDESFRALGRFETREVVSLKSINRCE